MTLQELKNEIAALGFESELEEGGAFSFAVKRAVASIYTERGIHKSLHIYQRNPKPDFHYPVVNHVGGSAERFSLADGAYFFRASGKGAFSVTDRNGIREYEFNSNNSTVRGYVFGGGEIAFYGNLSYTVYDLCHFTELHSDNVDDLNFGGFTAYDLRKSAPDYLGPCDSARDESGKIIEGASICSGILSVPYSYNGEIVVKYRCTPVINTDSSADTVLDIDPECEHLLPLLVAAYVWLDDDEEKASYYMSLYREGMAALKLYSPRCINSEYEDVTRWA